MRTTLIVSVLSLLPTLPAQAPPSKTAEPLPLPAEEAVPAPAADLQARRAGLGRDHEVAGRPQSRVLFDRPRADGSLWAMGTAWKASFDARGFTAIPFFGSEAPHDFPVRFELAQATVGGEPLALADGEPVAIGNRVRTPRGPLAEVIDASLEHLEQSFVFDTLPNRGAIGVDVHITSELAASRLDHGVRFGNEFGHVDYEKAVAIDAAGQRLPLAITWNGARAHLEIPAAFVATAQLPIVLDPVLTFAFHIGAGQTQLQHDSDVASFQSLGGRTLLIYQRQYSASDTDCWGVMFDGNLNLVQTDFIIDFTADDWFKVAVAANNHAQNFLVVAQIHVGSFNYIGGRLIAANAVPGAVFDIERDGVVGSGGYNWYPDVGGDPYHGVGRYTVVFYKDNGAQSGIYLRQLTTAGGQVTANPTALDITGFTSRPSICKSCGQSNGLPAWWLVTWQRTYPFAPYDQDCYGRFVNWNGALTSNVFTVAFTAGEDTAPSPGSPFEFAGVRYWPVALEYASGPGQPRDVRCRLFQADTSLVNAFTVNSAIPGSDDHDPEMDSDGTRFVVCFTSGTPGYASGVAADLFAYLPATNSFRFDGGLGLLTSGSVNYGQCNIHADYSGGNTTSPRYFISYTDQGSNTLSLFNEGGWVNGQLFSPRPSQCGTAAISVTGLPVIGQTLTFDVQPGPLAAVHIGLPTYISLSPLGCSCWQGVDPIATFVSPWTWNIPAMPAAVGLSLSAQGFHITGTQCLGFIDVSDTIDFTIR